MRKQGEESPAAESARRATGAAAERDRTAGAPRVTCGTRSITLNDEAPGRARSAHGTGPRARRLQDIESDTRYDTRRCSSEGALAGVSQTAVYDTC